MRKCEWFNLLSMSIKVDEVLRFQSQLRMNENFNNKERMARVKDVIVKSGLSKCRDSLIGNAEKNIKGISGGVKKRLAVACEVSFYLILFHQTVYKNDYNFTILAIDKSISTVL